jgi:hypothetical protein
MNMYSYMGIGKATPRSNEHVLYNPRQRIIPIRIPSNSNDYTTPITIQIQIQVQYLTVPIDIPLLLQYLPIQIPILFESKL